jgi:hypothetical protein
MDAPWSTKGAIILDADHHNATEWSSYVKPIIKYHKALSLLTTAPTAEQDNLVAQLILFLTQTIHHSLHSVISDDDPKSTWEAIQALKPNNATRLEQLANEITSLALSDTSASEYVSAHRAANTTFLSIDPTHHYSNPQTYLQRILSGLKSSPHLAALILHHRNTSHVSTTLINTIFTDIIDATPDDQPIATSTRHHRPNYTSNHPSNRNNNRNNNRNKYRNNNSNRFGRRLGLPGVKYACMRCKKDNHTDADCSFKDSATSHVAHQVQVQVAAALATYLPTHSEITQSDVDDQYTTIPSRILLDSAVSTSMAPDTRHHHRTSRSRMLVTVANANTTRATDTGPATLPTLPTANP